MLDFSNMPAAGGAVAVGLFYAGVSLFVAGPLVGERMVDKMEWAARCAAHLRAEAEAQAPADSIAPGLACSAVFGALLGPEGRQLCAAFENGPVGQTLQSMGNAGQEAHRRRLNHAATRAGSRCECAVTTTLENRRVPLALHAGSARLITPPSVRLLGSDLVSSLNGPACAMKG